MTEFVALRSLVFAAECFFGASLILAAAWMLARDGSAARRHLVWLVAFVAMLILPIAAWIVPPQVIVTMPAEPALTAAELAAIATLPAAPAAPGFTLYDAMTLLFAVWLAGVAVIALRTLGGLAGLARLHRRSVPHIPNGISGEKFRGARWQLRLRTAPGNEGPVTYGIFKSIVLLPKASVRWPRERLEAVLLHEFAHVQRRDCLARLIALTACAFYWPNPFVWSAASRLKREAEIAADDRVLEAGVRASSYAEALVGLAREFEPTAFAAVTMSMAEQSGLKDRVKSVLSAAHPRKGVSRMDVLKIGVSCLALTAGLALARPCLAEAKAEAPVAVHQPKHVAHAAHHVVNTGEVDAPDDVVDEPNDAADEVADAADAAEPAPSEPEMPAAPPAPLAPAVMAAPPAPAAVPAPPAPPPPHAVRILHIDNPGSAVDMHIDRAQIERDRAQAHVWRQQSLKFHREEMRRATEIARKERAEEFRRAMEEARPAFEEARKLKDAEIRRALADARQAARQAQAVNREEVRKALAQAHVSRIKALEETRAIIDRELAKAHREAEEASSERTD